MCFFSFVRAMLVLDLHDWHAETSLSYYMDIFCVPHAQVADRCTHSRLSSSICKVPCQNVFHGKCVNMNNARAGGRQAMTRKRTHGEMGTRPKLREHFNL